MSSDENLEALTLCKIEDNVRIKNGNRPKMGEYR